MGLTTKTGNSGQLNMIANVIPPTTNVFNYSSGPGVLRQIFCQLPSNTKVLKIRITLDDNIIFEDLMEDLNSISKSTTIHNSTYRFGHELDLHFVNNIDVTIFGVSSNSSIFPYRVACTCICDI